jgi:hypothetical protein
VLPRADQSAERPTLAIAEPQLTGFESGSGCQAISCCIVVLLNCISVAIIPR